MRILSRVFLFCFIAALAACGYNVKSIKTFEAGSSSLTDSYSVLVNQTAKWCRQSHRYYGLTSPDYAGQKSLDDYVSSQCDKYEKQNKAALISNSIVNGYAQALVMAVGVSPQYLNDDLSKMGDVVTALKNGEGNPLIKPDTVELSKSLAQTLAEYYVVSEVKKKAVTTIQQNRALINEHIDIMLGYAHDSFKAEHTFAKTAYSRVTDDLGKVVIPIEHDELVRVKDVKGNVVDIQNGLKPEESLPIRFLLSQVTKEQAEMINADEAIAKLDAAGAALKIANDDLERNFETLSKDEQLKSVIAFAKKAQELRESVKKINE